MLMLKARLSLRRISIRMLGARRKTRDAITPRR